MQDATVTMAFGRRYGLVGRNGTGKTTLLRAMAQHQIKGIPDNCQILHVEQEVSPMSSINPHLKSFSDRTTFWDPGSSRLVSILLPIIV